VVPVRADWTNPDPVISDYLASFGRYGIPFNVVYGPGAPDGVPLPELLTQQAVLAAIDLARGGAISGTGAQAASTRLD
jgi:suppressor for copper-sensitivity B